MKLQDMELPVFSAYDNFTAVPETDFVMELRGCSPGNPLYMSKQQVSVMSLPNHLAIYKVRLGTRPRNYVLLLLYPLEISTNKDSFRLLSFARLIASLLTSSMHAGVHSTNDTGSRRDTERLTIRGC